MKRLFLPVVSALFLLTNCSQPTPPTGKLSVVATIYPLAFLAEQVGGDFVSVLQITPGGVEPHDYEPSPQQLAEVHSAAVFLMNGAGVDAWADKVRDDVAQNGVMTLRMTDSVTFLNASNEEGGVDPHVWLDLFRMQRQAELVRDVFIKEDPAHAETYEKNAAAFMEKTSALDGQFSRGLAHCAQNTIVVSHDAFRYVAERYKFSTLAIAGLSPDEEPSSKRIADLADFAKRENIQYIFFETLVSPKLAETLANEIGATPLVLNPIEGLTSDEKAKGATYFTLMADNLTNLRTALQCP